MTGVQTCALPIWQAPGLAWGPGRTLERAKPSDPPGYHCASPLLTRLPTSTEDPQTTRHGPTRAPEGTPAGHHGRQRGLAPARQHGRYQTGTGISTRHPSTTPVGLALGPDSPREDEPAPGTLGLSALGTPTPVIATHACILTPTQSTPRSPPGFTPRRTLPYHPHPPHTYSDSRGAGPRPRRRA